MLILCTLLFVHVHSMIIFPKMKPPSHIHFSARECVYGNVNTLIKAHTRPGGTHFLCAKKWARNKILNRYHKMSDIQSFNFHRLFFKLTGLWKVDGYVIVPLSLSRESHEEKKMFFRVTFHEIAAFLIWFLGKLRLLFLHSAIHLYFAKICYDATIAKLKSIRALLRFKKPSPMIGQNCLICLQSAYNPLNGLHH